MSNANELRMKNNLCISVNIAIHYKRPVTGAAKK